MSRTWARRDVEVVRTRYADCPTSRLAQELGRSVLAIHRKAHRIGARKESGYLSRLRQTPIGRMADTQFKAGSRGRFLLPIGSEVVNSNGYRLRKVQHTGRAHRDWRLVHLLLWEEHLGPVPPGHCITFKNERKDDIRIDNLACISRSERMKRNSYWTRYPKEIARLIQLRGQLSRVINKRERNAAKHS